MATPQTASPPSDGAADAAKAKASDAADQAKDKAQEAAGQAKGQVRDQVDQRSTQAGEQVNATASDLRAVADGLQDQGKDGPAKLAHQAADRAERLGGYLTGSDADTILADVEDYARSNPWAVVAGGIAAGFVASRMLKASSTNRSSAPADRGPRPSPVAALDAPPQPSHSDFGSTDRPSLPPSSAPTTPGEQPVGIQGVNSGTAP